MLLLLGCALWIACSKEPKAESTPAADRPPPPPGSVTAARPKAAATSELTGVLSEEGFKQLHELKPDEAKPLNGKMLNIGTSAAYLSLPDRAKAPLPAVVMIHEWWGLNDHIKHWADRLALDGYAALAVDLYKGQVGTTPDEAMSLMKAVDPSEALKTLKAAYDFLKTDPRIQARKRASLGWCFGGKWSLNLALSAPDLDAAIVYYGHVTTDPKELAHLKSPLLGIFGNQDTGIPPATVDKFEQALKDVKANYAIHRYDAQHAFANPSSARYNEEAASAAWDKTRAFLASHLKE